MDLEKKSILSKNVFSQSGGRISNVGGGGGGGGGGGDGGSGGSGHLTVLAVSVFLVGEMAGAGVMALPYAMEGTGYIGIPLILLCCTVSCYTGHLIGQCWLIVQARYPEYRGHVRHPYPVIAYVCYGKIGRTFLSWMSNFSMVGSGVVVMIMASQSIHRLLMDLADVRTPFCLIQVFVAGGLLPWTWSGTPKDFWVIALGATLSTTVAVVLCLVIIAMDIKELSGLGYVGHSNTNLVKFFQAASTIVFASGGHFTFPTFQNDMKHPEKFTISLVISFTAMVVLYIPLALMGYIVYGDRLSPNLLLTLSPGPTTVVVIVLVTCHQLCAFVIIVNPCMQHMDEVLGIAKEFSWKRVVSRTSFMLFLLFIAESVPRFGVVMSLLGGSSNLFVMLIAPIVYYLRLCQISGGWPKIHVPLHIRVMCVEILVVGAAISIFSTYGNALSLWGSSSFTVPCYINMTASEGG